MVWLSTRERDNQPNAIARYVPMLTDADLATMIGFDGTNRDARYKARKAFRRLSEDGVIELEKTPKGFRLFGPKDPKVD